jgi:hypothetical protein
MCLEASIIQGLKHQESFSFVQFQRNALTFMCQMFKKSVTCSRKLSAISESHDKSVTSPVLIDFEPLTIPNERVLHFCHLVHYESEIM